ncbi:MAG: hypothetical protein CSA65_06290 [Proteobacteria bacterium]|nr:MAG: hypothetical protein CSA65_06290 [Pseudomonadota bacterium]
MMTSCGTTATSGPERVPSLRTAIKRRPAIAAPKGVIEGLKRLLCARKLLRELKPLSWSRPLYDFEMDSEGVALLTSANELKAVFGCTRFVNWTTHRLLLVWYGMSDVRPIAFKAGVQSGKRLTFDLVSSRVCTGNTPHRLRAARIVMLRNDGSTIEVRRVDPPSTHKPCPPSSGKLSKPAKPAPFVKPTKPAKPAKPAKP